MKKVILIILFVLVIGAGVAGTLYFYNQNKNQIQQNELLAAQNSQVQAQLNAIGTLVECYEVTKNVYSGNEVLEADLVAVTVPASTLSTSSVTDKTMLVGRHYRVDVKPGTILSMDMLMDEDEEVYKFPFDLTLTSLPVSTVEGDYIDIRMLLPNGEEYVVLNHKQIKGIYNSTTIQFDVTEEENAILISMMSDIGIYNSGCVFYVTKYLEPGNSNSIAFYPVQKDMENFVRFNVNIEDTTRCINTTLRAHIDEVLLIYTDSNNQNASTMFISQMKTQLSGQVAAQSTWISEHTDENGNLVTDKQNNTGSGNSTGDSTSEEVIDPTNIQQQTGEAMDQIEENIEDLEAIQ